MSRVATRLVTLSTGRTPSAHSADTMPAPDRGSTPIVALPLSACHVFSIGFWNGVGAPTTAGTHTRVGPDGFSTSTLVVISKVRHAASVSGANASRGREPGSARPSDSRPEYSRKRRRFMRASLSSVPRPRV